MQHVFQLVGVQLCVDRHGAQAGVPDGELGLGVLDAVLHRQGDPVAGLQAQVVAQPAGQGADAPVQFPVGQARAPAAGQGGTVTVQAHGALEELVQVHGDLIARKSGRSDDPPISGPGW
ncbi:hypothetical protein SDC9_212597 [bioreactor metagenome]|uniref:Uncharacterized protein n=1 Tax=bioreactor metagenome TaxID=1076179 RepID=A0A645JP16_9ZZZZ